MPTFAELLVAYTKRTGVSDAELARAAGVRRQTIFRWKEGLVERPRRRAEVLRCVEKLRLSAEERDALLLAAGFAPESLPVASAPRSAPMVVGLGSFAPAPSGDATVTRTVLAEPAQLSAVAPPPLPDAPSAQPHVLRRRRVPRRIAAGAVAIVLALLAAGFAVTLSEHRDGRVYPVAAPGEMLVLVGAFGPSTASGAPSGTARADLGERLQAAIAREVRAGRLDGVRVAAWPDPLPDGALADTARRRASGAIAIGGTDTNGTARLALATQSAGGRVDDLPLEALARLPTDLSITIASANADEVRALALLVAGQIYLARGDREHARAALVQALSAPSVGQSLRGMLELYRGYLALTARPPDLPSTVVALDEAIGANDSTEGRLDRGLGYIRMNDPAYWRPDLERAAALAPNDSGPRLGLCWADALDNRPAQALPSCDAAANGAAAVGQLQEPRAIAEAEKGDLARAAADLRGFLAWLDTQSPELRARYGSAPSDWLQALDAGHNPFNAATLEALRRE